MLNKLKKKIKGILPFSSKEYWETRYKDGGNSGGGSYNKKAMYKADILNTIIEENKIENIIEFGCGDGNNLQYYNIENYLGFDVSETAIKMCVNKFHNDNSRAFILYNPTYFKSGKGLQSELTISFEVVFHLIEDDVFNKYIHNLFETSSSYVLICSSNSFAIKTEVDHVKHRKFTDSIPKNFSLVRHIKTPREGELKDFFSDFYLFKKMI